MNKLSFKEWQEATKDDELEQIMVNRNSQRIIYKINNVNLYRDLVFPSNRFEKSYEISVVDLQFEITEENKKRLKNIMVSLLKKLGIVKKVTVCQFSKVKKLMNHLKTLIILLRMKNARVYSNSRKKRMDN